MWITTHLTPMIILIWSNDNMKTDIFWKIQTENYCKAYAFFRKNFIAETGIEDTDLIDSHWYNFIGATCDCEGCREDEDCVIRIDIPTDEDDVL